VLAETSGYVMKYGNNNCEIILCAVKPSRDPVGLCFPRISNVVSNIVLIETHLTYRSI